MLKQLVKILPVLVLCGLSLSIRAQEAPAPTLINEYVFTIEADITEALQMGETVDGVRRAIPITGGRVYGKDITGEVLPGGADYQVDRSDGSTQIRAVYMIKTEDGAIINVVNEGLIIPPGVSDNDQFYFRTAPQFIAPNGKYGWLNNSIFVCTVRFLPSAPNTVMIDVYKVL